MRCKLFQSALVALRLYLKHEKKTICVSWKLWVEVRNQNVALKRLLTLAHTCLQTLGWSWPLWPTGPTGTARPFRPQGERQVQKPTAEIETKNVLRFEILWSK
jgi:hypothetical protein